jgi:hypothetical protein
MNLVAINELYNMGAEINGLADKFPFGTLMLSAQKRNLSHQPFPGS